MISDFEKSVFSLINNERTQRGLDLLKIDEQLNMAADFHSESMAEDDFFSHRGIDGSSPFDRMKDQGYSYRTAGENIAAGYQTPESVVKAWMGSSGHRANILNAKFTEIGIGHEYNPQDTGNVNYNHYWTTNFATPI